MHYGTHFFTTNGQPTIVPLNTDAEIGQRFGFSTLDVEQIKRLFKVN